MPIPGEPAGPAAQEPAGHDAAAARPAVPAQPGPAAAPPGVPGQAGAPAPEEDAGQLPTRASARGDGR